MHNRALHKDNDQIIPMFLIVVSCACDDISYSLFHITIPLSFKFHNWPLKKQKPRSYWRGLYCSKTNFRLSNGICAPASGKIALGAHPAISADMYYHATHNACLKNLWLQRKKLFFRNANYFLKIIFTPSCNEHAENMQPPLRLQAWA